MKQFAFTKASGEVAYVISPGSDSDYTDGETYGDLVAREIPHDANQVEFAALNVWQDGDWIARDARPSPQHLWIDGAWQVDQVALVAAIEQERDRRLNGSIWAMLPDAPLTAPQLAEWVAYRNALRAVPTEVDNIADVEWPTPPS